MLFGFILSVTRSDVMITLASGVITLLLLAFLFRPLLFASIDPEVAQARGVPVRLLSMAFLMLLGVTTAETILVVGVLLVLALLIAPAATALHVTSYYYIDRAVGSAGPALHLGTTDLAFVGTGRHLPVSFYISALAGISYFASMIAARIRTPRRHRDLPHPCGEHVALPDRRSPVQSDV